ncbi:unnamed protein product, partial [Polarella glacialis]
ACPQRSSTHATFAQGASHAGNYPAAPRRAKYPSGGRAPTRDLGRTGGEPGQATLKARQVA